MSRRGVQSEELGDMPCANGDTLNALYPQYVEVTERLSVARETLRRQEAVLRAGRETVRELEQQHGNLATRLNIWWVEHRDKVSSPLRLCASAVKQQT